MVFRSEAAGTTAVVLSCWPRQMREEICIIVGPALSVLESVVECGEILAPLLDSRVVVPNLSDVFQSFVFLTNAKLRVPKVSSKMLDRPIIAICLQIEQSPISFRVEGSAANMAMSITESSGRSLLKRSAKHIHAGVVVHTERTAPVLHGAPIGEDKEDTTGGTGRSASKSRTMAFMVGVN